MSSLVAGMVRLSELPDRVLLNILRRRGYALARNGVRFDDGDRGCVPALSFDEPVLCEAEACCRAGDVAEALIWLERARPDTFAGLSTAAVPARSS